MSRGHESQRADAERVVAGDAAPEPGISRQVRKELQGAITNCGKLFDVAVPRPFIGAVISGGDILTEAGQRRLESTGKPESTKGEQPFAIVEVGHDTANAPLVRGIAMAGPLRWDASQKCDRLGALLRENVADVAGCDEIDVVEVILRRFIA